MAWYALMDTSDPTNAGKYRRLPIYDENNPPPCGSGCVICAIFVTGSSDTPTINDDLMNRIAIGLVTGTRQRPAGFPPQPYDVLLRC